MNELQRYLVEEAVEDYEEGRLTRREALKAIAGITGAALAAQMLEARAQAAPAGKASASSLPWARGDRVGMTGFCFGGAVTWRVAAGVPDLRAAVPFYGVPVQEPDVPGIGAAVFAIYGGLDDRINQNIPAIEAAMGKHGKTFRKIVYPNVDHAFHNDTGPRYNAAAAKAAWGEALAWVGK